MKNEPSSLLDDAKQHQKNATVEKSLHGESHQYYRHKMDYHTSMGLYWFGKNYMKKYEHHTKLVDKYAELWRVHCMIKIMKMPELVNHFKQSLGDNCKISKSDIKIIIHCTMECDYKLAYETRAYKLHWSDCNALMCQIDFWVKQFVNVKNYTIDDYQQLCILLTSLGLIETPMGNEFQKRFADLCTKTFDIKH